MYMHNFHVEECTGHTKQAIGSQLTGIYKKCPSTHICFMHVSKMYF